MRAQNEHALLVLKISEGNSVKFNFFCGLLDFRFYFSVLLPNRVVIFLDVLNPSGKHGLVAEVNGDRARQASQDAWNLNVPRAHSKSCRHMVNLNFVHQIDISAHALHLLIHTLHFLIDLCDILARGL